MAPWVVFLMRLNILGSGRYDIFSNEMPDHYVLSNRPSFKKNKNGKTSSDATEYAFFVWGPERGRKFGKSYILPTMSLSERKMLNSSIPQHSLIF